eukprot:868262-Pelagomonas_calceolata.AAC.1
MIQSHSLLLPDSSAQKFMSNDVGMSELEYWEGVIFTFNARVCQRWGLSINCNRRERSTH